MPRVRLDPEYWKLLLKDELGQYRQEEIAKVIGSSQQTVSRKLRTMNFTLPEFRKIVKTTGMADEVILRIIRGQP